jgi:hypothetical protein
MPDGKDLDAAMAPIQSSFKGTLNAVWAEKARLTVKSAVPEQVLRAKNNLFGRFKHLNTVGTEPLKDGSKRLVNFPEEWSAKLSADDVNAMQALAESLDYAGTLALFRKLEADKPLSGLTVNQRAALKAMLGMVAERYTKPTWDGAEGVLQLHLDVRCISGGREAQDSLLRRLTQAANQTFSIGQCYTTTFLMAGVVAHGAPIKLNATIIPEVVQPLLEPVRDGATARFTSVVIEISSRDAVVKGVLSQQPKPLTLGEVECLLGNDFGLVNTAAAVLVKLDEPLDQEWVTSVKDWTKEQSKAYLETHSHDGGPIAQVMFSGRNFLKRIEEHALHIDRLRSEIDCVQNRLIRMKKAINAILGLPADTFIDLNGKSSENRQLADLVTRFAKLLDVSTRLKLIRRRVYRTVDDLKKAWFGFITTKLAVLCRDNKAAYVRENLTILAKEKAAPDYWGRTMNKMMNNGSKGQFLRRATSKLKWYGVPELVVPSYYTSSTDVRHSVVDKKQRNGEKFKATVDGWQMHADLHAGLTIALWLQLRPRPVAVG